MKDLKTRLKSPVVIAQLLTIAGAIVVTLLPNTATQVDTIVYALTIIVNVFAGVNNPTERGEF